MTSTTSTSATATSTGTFARALDKDPESEREDKLVQEAIFTNYNDSMSVSISVSVSVSESSGNGGSGGGGAALLAAPTVVTTEYTLGDVIAELFNRIAPIYDLTGLNTIYYRSGDQQWSPVAFGGGLTFAGGILTGGGGGTGGGIPEAPINNIAYGRYNSIWRQVLMSTGDILDGGNF